MIPDPQSRRPQPPAAAAGIDGRRQPRRRLRPHLPARRPGGGQGYILLEAILALMIFAVAIVGLVQALNTTLDVTNTLERDAMVRQALRSFAAEVQVERDIGSMRREEFDELRDIRFSAEIEQATLSSEGRRPLRNLYELTVTATYPTRGGERQEIMQIYLHRPR